MINRSDAESWEPSEILGGLYGDGIIGLRGAFSVAFADRLRTDIEALFEEAKAVPGGALPRGPERFYVEVQPERIRGFVEIGFDIPFPGAADQPWHRDFAVPEATTRERRLNSLAFNLTAVDTRPEHGPFEIAPGTQWDQFDGCERGMFPPPELWPRYQARAVQKLPQRGDISARSALTVHRGTANRSNVARPVLVVGVDAPDATNAAHHDLQVTCAYAKTLPSRVIDHLHCRTVDALEPVVQHHVIEGLLAPVY